MPLATGHHSSLPSVHAHPRRSFGQVRKVEGKRGTKYAVQEIQADRLFKTNKTGTKHPLQRT